METRIPFQFSFQWNANVYKYLARNVPRAFHEIQEHGTFHAFGTPNRPKTPASSGGSGCRVQGVPDPLCLGSALLG